MGKTSPKIIVTIATFIILWSFKSSLFAGDFKELRVYDYRDTKKLVMLVQKAAKLISLQGDEAFTSFKEQKEKWTFAGCYLYVYNRKGVNLFHGGYPNLVGKNLINFTDSHGKKGVQMLIRESDNANNPHGWIHYLWRSPGALDYTWKSSCNFMVKKPDGGTVFIGSGIDSPQPEREFFRIIVNAASDLLKKKGQKALPLLKSPASRYAILDSKVFISDMKGNSIIPLGIDLEIDQNMFEYKDLTGRHPVKELALKLESSDNGWVVMLNKGRIGGNPIKKTIYGRNSSMDGKKVIVGAICKLPRPAWMNSNQF
ncbi:MAG: hypothetical protein GY710_20165 [Desulfobacteraceae bacterium]|nr:hypothetical protein [Desulfobacteraceae bacterium]